MSPLLQGLIRALAAVGKVAFLTGSLIVAAWAVAYVANGSRGMRPAGQLTLLSHRGVHQTFSEADVDDQTCTARKIFPPTHLFIENTLPSIRRALDLGADIVEIDVHPTSDGEFVVFHDWTLECRTDGRGVTRDHTLGELKALDAGYGYTADGGRSFPLRGLGRGLIPSLADVLLAFPDGRFLVNIKSNDPSEAERLAAYLAIRAPTASPRLTVYGAVKPIARLKALRPDIAAWSVPAAKECLITYELTGWFGRIPEACRQSMVFVPEDQAWLIWGWPNRFLRRMRDAGSTVFIAGEMRFAPRPGFGGVDAPRQIERLPKGWTAGVSTERIEVVGPLLKPPRPKPNANPSPASIDGVSRPRS